jgi:hypothetical protein
MASLRDFVSSFLLQRGKDVGIGFLVTCAIIVVLYYLVPLAHSLFFSPLRKIPGPLLARVTRWWEYRMVIKGHSHLEYIRLHKKYGV